MSDVCRHKFVLTGILMLLLFLGFLLTLQPIPAAALAYTATPLPTATTTAVPHVNLPSWMNDPNTAVFVLFPYLDMSRGGAPVFVNAVTDERFKLDFSYVDEMHWIKAADGVYIELERAQGGGWDESTGFLEYINLATGTLKRLGFDGRGAPVAVNEPSSPAARDNGANMRYELVAQTYWVADDAHDMFHTQTYSDLLLTDSTTGETLSLYHNQLSRYGTQQLGIQWFDNGQRLGVWFHYPFDTNQADRGDHVDIFDTSGARMGSRRSLLQVRWSERHSRMLYRDYYNQDNICVVDSLSLPSMGGANCTLFQDWQKQQQSRIEDYEWSPDGRKIIFSYEGNDLQSGGLCIADASTFDVTCPIKKTFSEGDFSGSYLEQPDNTYALFSYTETPSSSDNAGKPSEAGLCLFNRETYAADCFTDRSIPAQAQYTGLSFAPSGHVAIMYTRRNRDGDNRLCSIDLQDGTVNCPDISAMSGVIDTYAWSPDSRFFLVVDDAGPESDDKNGSHYGLFDIATGVYRDEGPSIWDDLTNVWRPDLKS